MATERISAVKTNACVGLRFPANAGQLDGYQKIIDGARQVVVNWKPRLKLTKDGTKRN
jgi:hypothetical protein